MCKQRPEKREMYQERACRQHLRVAAVLEKPGPATQHHVMILELRSPRRLHKSDRTDMMRSQDPPVLIENLWVHGRRHDVVVGDALVILVPQASFQCLHENSEHGVSLDVASSIRNDWLAGQPDFVAFYDEHAQGHDAEFCPA